MPYLNWKDHLPARLKPGIGPLGAGEHQGSSDKLRMTLAFEAELLGELLPRLREAFGAPGATELRLDLPRNWIVFWKKREGESRLLLAHPQADEWVATVALTAEDGRLLVERLETMVAGQSVSLGELAATGNVSNLELTLVLN